MAKSTTQRAAHLSHSQVQEFTQCPRRYHLHRRLGLAPEFMPSGLLFGIGVHEALSLYHQLRLQGQNAAPDQLYAAFDDHWTSEVLPVRYGNNETEGGLKATARKMIAHYVANPVQHGEVLAVEEPFTLKLAAGLPPVHGRIDLVERDTKGGLVLTDFKTAKSRTEPDPDQLVLYREAVQAFDVGDREDVTVRFVCLLKTVKPGVAIYEPDIAPAALPALVSRYEQVWQSIESGCSFPITGWRCAGCQWSKYCDQA